MNFSKSIVEQNIGDRAIVNVGILEHNGKRNMHFEISGVRMQVEAEDPEIYQSPNDPTRMMIFSVNQLKVSVFDADSGSAMGKALSVAGQFFSEKVGNDR